jgi:hypothetical protein
MKLNIPNGTFRLDDIYLNQFKNVRKVSLPSSLKELPLGAFYQCMQLKKIFFSPDIQIKKIPEKSFQGCYSLENFLIPSSVVSIDKDALKNVTSIKEIEIPETVTFVDEHAFDGWKENQIIYIYNRDIVFSKACEAEVVLLKEDEIEEEAISDNHYMVIAKGGHVGRDSFMPMYIPVKALSKKEASDRVRVMPRVKKHHKDVILSVFAISKQTFYKQLENNAKDPYYLVHSKHEQNKVLEQIKDRLLSDPNYRAKKNKRYIKKTNQK